MGRAATSRPARSPNRSPNRRGEGGYLRADILAAATRLLDRADERALTLRAVAREAGIATPSIYPHFADQRAILLAVVRAAFGDLSRSIAVAMQTTAGETAAGKTAAGKTAPQRLYAVSRAYLDFAATYPRRYRAMSGSAWRSDTPANSPPDLDGSVLRIFTGVLGDCVAAGYSASADPAADAIALWLGLHGLAHQRAVYTVFPWSGELVPTIVDALAHIGPNPSLDSNSPEVPHVRGHPALAGPRRRDPAPG